MFMLKVSDRSKGKTASSKKKSPNTSTKVSDTVSFAPVPIPSTDGDQYEDFLAAVKHRFDAVPKGTPMFTTSGTATVLMDVFLKSLPETRRSTYLCQSCSRFMERYGGLVTIAEDGSRHSVLWDARNVPPMFAKGVQKMADLVERAEVDGVFLSSDPIWGTPSNHDGKRQCDWHHLSVTPPKEAVFRRTVLKNADQAMAEYRENFAMLNRGLADFREEWIRAAYEALRTGQLYRSEKCEHIAKWLLDLVESTKKVRGDRLSALRWLAVAKAPAGYTHVRSGMIGTLLEDLGAGLPFDDVKRRFAEKMNPLQYMRPQTAPSEGNIEQAEKIMAALRTQGALQRRFARAEEVPAIWKPRAVPQNAGAESGVFGHLRPKTTPEVPVKLSSMNIITFDKFRRTVLNSASKMEVYVPSRISMVSVVTAVNPDSPPMLQWDRDDARNPLSWFYYVGGRDASYWGLTGNRFYPVASVAEFPSNGLPNQGNGAMFLIEGASNKMHTFGGGMFPECLRSEYHPIRRTLEAYFQNAVLADALDSSAVGMTIRSGTGQNEELRVRVTSNGTVSEYIIDRWD